MTFDIVLAKTYFTRETDTDFDTALTAALVPAKNVFKTKFGIDEFMRFSNFTNPVVSTLKTNDNQFAYDDAINHFKVGDMITLDSILFSVLTVGSDYIIINEDYTGAELSITNETMVAYQSVFAWQLLYMMTFTAKELITKILLQESQQHGEGNIVPGYDPVKSYRKELKTNIYEESVALKVNQPPIEMGRR